MSLCDNCMKYPCTDGMSVMLKSCPAFFPIPKPLTNADRIRAMTDEELAEFMDNGCDVIAPSENCTKAFYECKKCWLDWLKQEVADEDCKK